MACLDAPRLAHEVVEVLLQLDLGIVRAEVVFDGQLRR